MSPLACCIRVIEAWNCGFWVEGRQTAVLFDRQQLSHRSSDSFTQKFPNMRAAKVNA